MIWRFFDGSSFRFAALVVQPNSKESGGFFNHESHFFICAVLSGFERIEMAAKSKISECELTPRQHAAIAALIAQPTRTAAAKAAGVGESTLRRWMADPAFKIELRRSCREAFGESLAMIQAYSVKAVQTLSQIASDKRAPAAARVSACVGMLKLAAIAFEHNAIEEIEIILAERRRCRPRLTAPVKPENHPPERTD